MGGPEEQGETLSLKEEIRRLRKTLSELTPPLSAMLRRRGFTIYKKDPPDDLLIPGEQFIDDYYITLRKYSFRLFLRDVIKHHDRFTLKDVTRYATQGVTMDYITYLAAIGLVEEMPGDGVYQLKDRPVRSFGPTLEWFLSEILRREFGMETIWGVKFRRPVIGGDYDLIGKINGSILYMEVKSSPPKQIYPNEIAAFFDRVSDLLPEVAVFFMDTELRMKDKIVPMFEEEMRNRSAGRPLPFPPGEVRRIEKELFHMDKKIFIMNAKDSIVHNIECVLRCYYRRT
jgi:hypothetical protein